KLEVHELLRRHARRQVRQQVAPVLPLEQRALGLGVRITELDAHQEAVELRFRQRESAHLMGGILRGYDEEGLRQAPGLAFGRHLMLLHRLEEGALGLGRGAVDLVGEDDLGENRPRMKLESPGFTVVDRYPENVGRQEVARELYALEAQSQGGGERVREHGLADPGYILDQQVAARDEAGDGEPDLMYLAENDAA